MTDLLALALTLPSQNTTARTRAWRSLKALGAAVLRDGVHVLPASTTHAARLATIADDIIEAGGTAELWTLVPRDDSQRARFAGLFDRTTDYLQLVTACRELLGEAALDLPAVDRRLKALQRQGEQITAIDFFPGEAREQAMRVLAETRKRVDMAQSPGEPAIPAPAPVRRNPDEYRGRCWATRARPRVDRLASAWLVRRHIDADATFLWLPAPADCPADAVGFDFDGATFTHTVAGVTFETLLASFGLDGDSALGRIGAVVHYLDAGGLPVPEGAGLAALLDGLHRLHADDDRLLAAALPVFDALRAHFSANP